MKEKQSKKRDKTALKKIIRYCDEIDLTNEQFGNSFENLQSNIVYKNALAMCILQIGELVTHFSDEFLATNNSMPWRKIREMRNIAAHNYGEFNVKILWDTMRDDIPALHQYCQTILETIQDTEPV
jgi:uncharacterized protein with HEPN domain